MNFVNLSFFVAGVVAYASVYAFTKHQMKTKESMVEMQIVMASLVLEYFTLLKEQGKSEKVESDLAKLKACEKDKERSTLLIIIIVAEYLALLNKQGNEAKHDEIMNMLDWFTEMAKKE